jgi:hypothetical protein
MWNCCKVGILYIFSDMCFTNIFTMNNYIDSKNMQVLSRYMFKLSPTRHITLSDNVILVYVKCLGRLE